MVSSTNKGAIQALLDEYGKAIGELKSVITPISAKALNTIIDQQTKDPDCVSIQTILSHIVCSGYTYVVEIRKSLGENIDYVNPVLLEDTEAYKIALNKMFVFNETLFQDYPHLELETHRCSDKITVRWGQHYDIEQLFEHAIVHILRHRRQIESFLSKV